MLEKKTQLELYDYFCKSLSDNSKEIIDWNKVYISLDSLKKLLKLKENNALKDGDTTESFLFGVLLEELEGD